MFSNSKQSKHEIIHVGPIHVEASLCVLSGVLSIQLALQAERKLYQYVYHAQGFIQDFEVEGGYKACF